MSAYVEKNDNNLLKKCLERWYWFIPSVALVVAYAWYMLQQEPRLYSVTGSIIVQEDKNSPGQLPEEAIIQGLPFKNRGSMDKQIQILKSRYLMERVVDSLGIDIVYFAERKFRNDELYKRSPVKVDMVKDRYKAYGRGLRLKQVDNSRFALIRGENDTVYHNYGVPFVNEGITYSLVRDTTVTPLSEVIQVNFIDPRQIAAWYSGSITLQKRAQSNVLSITSSDAAPEKLVDIMFKLVDVYNAFVQEEKNKIAAQSLNFINDRLTDLSSDLFSVESSQSRFKTVSGVTTSVGTTADQYNRQLTAAEAELAIINDTRNTLNNLQSFLSEFDNQFEPIPSFGDLGGVSFADLITSYNNLVSARAATLVHATPKHPDVVRAEQDLEVMSLNILKSIRYKLNELREREGELVQKTAPVEQKVRSLPEAQRRLDEIGREKNVKEELVIYMLTKREETAIGLSTRVDNTRILDAPVIGPTPISPSSKQYYMVALLMGLAVPTGVVFLLEKINDKINSREEVKAICTVPFLGDVAIAKSERNRLITANSHSAIAEMFRLIRTNLQFLPIKEKSRVVLVTSNMSGDGKTFVSTNLGICLSLTNKKTVILELDLRKPKLTEFLTKKPPTVGITNYLVGEKDVPEIVKKVEGHENLYLVSCGPKPPNPAELLMGERMEQLIERLKLDYDYIVLDTPPTGLVADAFLLNKFVANAIFVVRAGRTTKVDLESVNELGEKGKLKGLSLILNGVKTPKRYGYYY